MKEIFSDYVPNFNLDLNVACWLCSSGTRGVALGGIRDVVFQT